MKQVTLLFADTRSLWSFAQSLENGQIQINIAERKLTCNCSDTEISQALIQYNAAIVDEVEERNHKI